MEVAEILQKKETIRKKQRLIAKHQAAVALLEKEIKDGCTCPQAHCVGQEYYYSGDYFNRAYTNFWDQCSLCGRKHRAYSITHNYYG